jgi:hypothetical protein
VRGRVQGVGVEVRARGLGRRDPPFAGMRDWACGVDYLTLCIHLHQVCEIAGVDLWLLHRELTPKDPDDGAAFEQTQVERNLGDLARGEADDQIPPFPRHAAQCRLRIRASDGVIHHVNPVRTCLFERLRVDQGVKGGEGSWDAWRERELVVCFCVRVYSVGHIHLTTPTTTVHDPPPPAPFLSGYLCLSLAVRDLFEERAIVSVIDKHIRPICLAQRKFFVITRRCYYFGPHRLCCAACISPVLFHAAERSVMCVFPKHSSRASMFLDSIQRSIWLWAPTKKLAQASGREECCEGGIL